MTAFPRAFRAAILAVAVLSIGPAVAQDAPVALVPLLTLGQGQTQTDRTFYGRAVARQTIDLGFQVAGQIVSFPVVEGQEIDAGSLIAELDQAPFILAVEEARLRERQALREADRSDQLADTVSAAQREAARTQAALASVARRNAELALRRSRLEAPFDAVVSTRSVANFTTVAAGQPVVRLHDMSELRIEIDVPEAVMRQAESAPRYDFLARFGGSDELHPLSLVEADIETGPVAGTYAVTLGMAPPKNSWILPGYSVAVVMRPRAAAATAPLVVPPDAVATHPDGSHYAMRFVPDGADEGRLQQVPVTIAADRAGRLVITAGLEAGAEIVSAGLAHLADGQAVRRFDGIDR